MSEPKKNRPTYEFHLSAHTHQIKDGIRAELPMVHRPTTWRGLDGTAMIAMECWLHKGDALLIQMGAQKELETTDWDKDDPKDAARQYYLRQVVDQGPILPMEMNLPEMDEYQK